VIRGEGPRLGRCVGPYSRSLAIPMSAGFVTDISNKETIPLMPKRNIGSALGRVGLKKNSEIPQKCHPKAPFSLDARGREMV